VPYGIEASGSLFYGTPESAEFGKIGFKKMESGVAERSLEVFAGPTDEIVNAGHLAATLEQTIDQMAADETGGACNEYVLMHSERGFGIHTANPEEFRSIILTVSVRPGAAKIVSEPEDQPWKLR
jgi:hypothetical protein